MKVEVQEFYQTQDNPNKPIINKRKFISGTVHVYIYDIIEGSDFAIDYRGINVIQGRAKRQWFTKLPFKKTFDENNEPATYTFFQVADPLVNDKMRKAIFKAVADFMNDKFNGPKKKRF